MATTIKKPDMANQYTNLAGISDATKQNLNYYGQGYQPSQQVQDAQKYLQSVIDKQPGEYQSQYQGQIQDLYQKIMDRPAFSYDVADDPIYQAYKDQYVRQGQQAMQDTVGNAAALTGGYGNSWAATAGSQAYQDYLTRLNGVIPELYQQAYERYGQEGQGMRQNLAMAQGLDDTAYAKYRDTVGDWQADRAFAAQQYDSSYQKEYDNWMAMLNMYAQLAQAENQNYWTEIANQPKGGGGGGGKKKSNAIAMGNPTQKGDKTYNNGMGDTRLLGGMGEYAKEVARDIANSPEGQKIIQELNKYDPGAKMQANLNAMNTQKQILTGSTNLAAAKAESAYMKANPGKGTTTTVNGKKVNVTPTMDKKLTEILNRK